MARLRCFIALPLPADIRRRAAKLCEQLHVAEGIRWVEPENLHLTLKFLGDVEQSETYDVCRAVQEVVAGFDAFTIEYHAAGAFPTLERPRTLWIGVREGADELIALQEAIDVKMADLGFRPEHRRFVPHLTIARVKKPSRELARVSDILAAHAEFEAGTAVVDEVTIYNSHLSPEGPTYTVLGTAPLEDE